MYAGGAVRALASILALIVFVAPAATGAENWPRWRGPLDTGEAPSGDPPVEWSEDQNVRWKIPLPGLGHSTPIVWGDRVFLTAAVPYGDAMPARHDTAHGTHDSVLITHSYEFVVFAIGREKGDIQWERTVHRALPHEGGHTTGSLASNSPVTDGERVFAFFGSRGLYCLSLDGDPLWDVDLGDKSTLHAHGEGSSPALHGDTVVVNWDHEGQSFLVAFDALTGDERWRTARDEVTSWATPIVVEHAGKAQVIVSGTKRVRSYDLATGHIIWECGGLSRNVVASPVSADGMVYAASSYNTQALLAIRLEGATGDITGSDQIVWARTRHTPYVPSPLLYGGTLYFLRHYQGILSRVHAETGEDVTGPVRLRVYLNHRLSASDSPIAGI
jgi:outer membrane protein assembly factor BamB